jgi:glucokinase
MPPPRVLAFDLGGSKLLGGVVDARGRAEERIRRPVAGLGREDLLDLFAQAVEEVRAGAPDAMAVGFGIPCLIDRRRGVSVRSVHLPLDELAFGAALEERVGLPVAWDNDANMALLAEHRLGAARGASEAVMLTLGTGIGGALVVDGRLYRGSTGAAGELGHTVVDIDGPPCSPGCPGRGCLEAFASGTAIGREGEAAVRAEPDSALGRALAEGRPATGWLVTGLALAGDPLARTVLERVGERLGAGLVSIVNALDPEVVVVGGGAMAGGELLLEPARRVLEERALLPVRDRVRVTAAELGEAAGVVGAGLAALELAGVAAAPGASGAAL